MNFWDFFDTPTDNPLARDGAVSGKDFFAVLARFNGTDAGPGDFDRNSDPLSLPNPAVPGANRANYHPAYDHASSTPTGAFNTSPPDGSISGLDFFAVLVQFNHQCS